MHTSNNNGDSMETKWDRKSKKTNGSSNTNNLNYSNNLFGCDVNNIEKAYGGLTLPPFIENALIYLARYGINAVGIFRKSGVKSRIMALRQKLESMTGSKKEPTLGTPVTTPSPTSGNKKFTEPVNNNASPKGRSATLGRHYNVNNFGPTGIGSGSSTINYRLSSSYAAGDDFCVYDVADMVKMWLREIKPRPLITKEVIKAYKELMMVNNPAHNNNNVNNNNDNDNNNLTNGPSPIELSLRLTVLLSDSQRAILEIFLHFLSLFAANSEVNQMNSQNLAICFTPSLCECDNLTGDFIGAPGIVNNNLPNNNNLMSNNQINGLPFVSNSDPNFTLNGSTLPRSADTEIIFDAQRCLQYLIDNCSSISMISLSSLPFSPVAPTLSTPTLNATKYENSSSSSSSLPMKNGDNSGDSDHPMDCSLSINDEQPCQQNNSSYTVNHLNPLMSSLSLSNDVNYNNHSKSSNSNNNSNNNNVNTNGFLHSSPSNSSLINGGNLLPSTYESSIIINAAPSDILKRILYQKNLFDPTVVEWRIVKQSPFENSDVFEYKVQSSFFLPLKTFTIDRRWSFIENQPFTETSSSPSPSRSFYSSLKRPKPAKASFKGIVLRETGYLYDSWWRIGTHGEGKCQLDISIAVDLRGHSYYWYTNTFPAIIDWQLYQIKQSFLVDFIETKNFKSTTV
uniref:Rho-GAP domain-containing protein n=2 Tax=Tetranychus urticae TaxID=32264 RepID=T1K9M6_TETUR